MDYKIREIQIDEYQKAADLHQKYYQNKRPLAVWKWEYNSYNPEKSVMIVIDSKGQIVGTQGMIPIYLNINGKCILTGKSESTLIDEEFRGKGLFVEYYNYAISQCEKKNMNCLWGFTRVGNTLKKVDYKVYEDVMKWAILPYNSKSIKKAAKSKSLIYSALINAGVIYSQFRLNLKLIRTAKNKKHYEIKSTMKSNDDIIRFYNRLRKKHKHLIHINQDIKYINWRIKNHPLYKTRTYYVYKGRILLGYLYLTIRNEQIEITDLMYLNDDVGNTLIKLLFNRIPEKCIIIYSGNIKNALNIKVIKLLKTYGFIVMKRPNDFILRNIKYTNEAMLYDIKNWYITDMWSEGVNINETE